jgi:hypothetical protein
MYLKTAFHTLSQNRLFDIKSFTSGEKALAAAKASKRKPYVIVLEWRLCANINPLMVLPKLGTCHNSALKL